MLTFRHVSRSLALLLLAAVATGVIGGVAVTVAAIALFLLLLACLEGKPAWKWFYDAPGSVDSGRASGRFFLWRRLASGSPRERWPQRL